MLLVLPGDAVDGVLPEGDAVVDAGEEGEVIRFIRLVILLLGLLLPASSPSSPGSGANGDKANSLAESVIVSVTPSVTPVPAVWELVVANTVRDAR